MLALVWFKLVQPDYRWRVVTFSVVLAALVSAHARLIWREGKGFASGFAVMVLASQAAIHIARALISFWMDAPDGNAFKPSPIQAAYLAAFSFSILLGGIGFVLMVSERLREEFEHLAAHDSLTGAMTRRAVLAAGQHEMGRWQRYGRPLSALMLDLDHFKRINDEHGHLAGDRVLIDVVKALREVLRHADVLGRYGGEEFIALLPEADSAAALVTAERLRAAVANACTLGGSAPCTVSIGLASTQPGDAHLDSLLTRADAALYRAKALGRNRVEPG
jgi:diguanylate cyclase (GGDEF)-like protein